MSDAPPLLARIEVCYELRVHVQTAQWHNYRAVKIISERACRAAVFDMRAAIEAEALGALRREIEQGGEHPRDAWWGWYRVTRLFDMQTGELLNYREEEVP